MKLNFTITLAILIGCLSFAQQGINYKAVIKDGSGIIVANTAIDVTFIILDGTVNVYEETQTPTTDANGIVILNIGEGTPVTGTFPAIDWSSNNHFLNVQIDTGGGLQDLGTTAFKTVPYAMLAKTLPGGIDQAYIDALEARIAELELPKIGDLRAGGIVFWIDPTDNTHGLVCALSDYVSPRAWGCHGTDLPSVPNVSAGPSGSGAEIGDGESNTNNILIDCPTSPAAIAVRTLGPEWFLPSAKELNEMYVNKAFLEAVPGFTPMLSSPYWSSTENEGDFAWFQNFDFGSQFFANKFSSLNVRAVRAF